APRAPELVRAEETDGVSVAGPIAMLVVGERQPGRCARLDAGLPDRGGHPESEDLIPGPRSELDVLMPETLPAELERVRLGAPDRDRDPDLPARRPRRPLGAEGEWGVRA